MLRKQVKTIYTIFLSIFLFSFPLLAEDMVAINPADKVIAQVLTKTVSLSTSMHNIQTLQDKKVNFAIINSDDAYTMKKSMPNLRSIAALYPKMLALITKKDANISSFSQLKEKKLHINYTCKETQSLCQLILPAFDIKSDFNTSTFADAKTKLEDGRIDGIFSLVGHPDLDIIQLNSELNITFVPLFGKKFDQLNNDHPYIVKGGIPKGIYLGLDKDIKSIGIKALLVTRKDVNESIISHITKKLLDNIKTIKTSNPIYRGISKKSLLEGLILPQHKGAKKAFNEK